MTDIEVIEALRTLLKPMQNQLDDIQLQLDSIRLDMKMGNRATQKELNGLHDEVDTLIAVLEAKEILPMVK